MLSTDRHFNSSSSRFMMGKGLHRCLRLFLKQRTAISVRQRIREDSGHAPLRTTMAAASVQPEAMLVKTRLWRVLASARHEL